MEYIDITYPVDDKLLIYPGDPEYKSKNFLSLDMGDMCNVACITMGCHTGTHIDAPAHFIKGGITVDQLDLNRFNGPVRVIECLVEGHITEELLRSCHIVPGERIIFKTKNSQRFAGCRLLEDYTAIDPSGADYLASVGVGCIGMDYLTIEPPESKWGIVHKTILGAGIPVIETLDLRCVSAGSYELVCLPLKLSGLDGSPVRALLRLPG